MTSKVFDIAKQWHDRVGILDWKILFKSFNLQVSVEDTPSIMRSWYDLICSIQISKSFQQMKFYHIRSVEYVIHMDFQIKLLFLFKSMF